MFSPIPQPLSRHKEGKGDSIEDGNSEKNLPAKLLCVGASRWLARIKCEVTVK